MLTRAPWNGYKTQQSDVRNIDPSAPEPVNLIYKWCSCSEYQGFESLYVSFFFSCALNILTRRATERSVSPLLAVLKTVSYTPLNSHTRLHKQCCDICCLCLYSWFSLRTFAWVFWVQHPRLSLRLGILVGVGRIIPRKTFLGHDIMLSSMPLRE